jgi:predicted TIM-barrel fold metal-dependent hydrolase
VIVDALAFLGLHPLRGSGTESPAELKRALRRAGVGRAYVAGLESLFRRNPWAANELHARRVAGSSLLPPLAGVNPLYAADRERLERLLELGFKGLVLAPLYHGFSPRAAAVGRLLRWAADLGVPVVLLCAIEDPRGSHRAYRFRYRVGERELAGFLELAGRAGARVLISHAEFSLLERLARAIASAGAMVDVASNTVYGPVYDRVKALVELFGEDRVTLSTGAPLNYPLVPILKVLYSDLDERARRKILSENALRFYERK